MEKQVSEGSLHKWFKGSKSKDGKGGWVNVVTGGTCASDEPGEGTPKCVSSAKRASMTKAERLSAARRKKKADPGQQQKSGAAKPTYVSTDKPKKKKMKETYERSLTPLTEKAKKCWPGYEKKGTKKMFGKTYNNCVKKEEVQMEDKKPFPTKKVDKKLSSLDKKMASKEYGYKRSDEKNRSFKIKGIKDAVKRGEDPRADTRGGAYAKQGNPPEDHRDHYSSNKRKRKVKPAGVRKEEVILERQKTNQGERQSEEQHRSNYGKASVRNMRAFGKGGNAADPAERLVAMDARHKAHKEKRGVKTKGMKEAYSANPAQQAAIAIAKKKKKEDDMVARKKKQKMYAGYEPEGETIEEADKKGKGSGTKDACYHKVKSRYSVWPSAYASGALVKCRKVGAANWGNSSKKEDFSDWKSEFIWEDGDSSKKLEEDKSPAWQRKEGKSESGGLNAKGVASYRRENPGSKLKTAVTTKPSKLKRGSKSAKRRKSFCSRMKGMKKKLTSAKTARDPDSRINKALRKWNC